MQCEVFERSLPLSPEHLPKSEASSGFASASCISVASLDQCPMFSASLRLACRCNQHAAVLISSWRMSAL